MPDHHLEKRDPSFRTGAVEDGKNDDMGEQVLPPWASTEPFGYEGSPADQQIVGGGENPRHASKGQQRRDVIGPGGD